MLKKRCIWDHWMRHFATFTLHRDFKQWSCQVNAKRFFVQREISYKYRDSFMWYTIYGICFPSLLWKHLKLLKLPTVCAKRPYKPIYLFLKCTPSFPCNQVVLRKKKPQCSICSIILPRLILSTTVWKTTLQFFHTMVLKVLFLIIKC